MKDFIYWFTEKLFSDKVNNAISWGALGLMCGFVLFQAVRFVFNIHI